MRSMFGRDLRSHVMSLDAEYRNHPRYIRCVSRPPGCRRTSHTTHTRHEMAAHRPLLPLLPLRRLLLLKSSGNRRLATQGPRTSCADTAPPPCAPCDRAAPPPCRALPRRTRPALRVTCCAPQPRAPPPCDPQHPNLTCLHARPICEKKGKMDCGPREAPCGVELDRVARRLAAAKSARREHYEREASTPTARAAAPAPVYRLATERECVRATDGFDYSLAAAAPRLGGECPRCGPDRQPPAPRPVDLAPSDACEPDRGLELDPCAHRPRVLLHVDRAPPQDSPQGPVRASVPPSGTCATPKRPSPRERLTSRIMETLSLKRESKGSYPKSSCLTTADPCANLPKPVDAPPRCREPSVVEQLRRRPGGTSGRRCGETRRQLHTSTSSAARSEPCAPTATAPPAPATKDANKNMKSGIEAVMRERSQLKEAARGRVVRPGDAGGPPAGLGAGRLELRIPPASESVSVRVSLDFMSRHNPKCASSAAAVAPVGDCKNTKHAASRMLTSSCDGSWLSIKGIQKKLSGYRSNDKLPPNSATDVARRPPARDPHGTSAARPGERPQPACGCRCPPRKPPRCSSAPEFPQILY